MQVHNFAGFDTSFFLGVNRLPIGAIWGTFEPTVEKSITAIGNWLQECRLGADTTHRECKPTAFRPQRLVTTGRDGAPPRLIQPRTEVKYTALSHCWGQFPTLRTTLANLAEFEKEIPRICLPKTFSDAIDLTRRLGIAHIWIDALCIV